MGNLDDFSVGLAAGIAALAALEDLAEAGALGPEEIEVIRRGETLGVLLLLWKHGVLSIKSDAVFDDADLVTDTPGDPVEAAAVLMERRIRQRWV